MFEVRGSGPGTPLIVANGGPGFDHSYLLCGDVWDRLARGRKVVFYDHFMARPSSFVYRQKVNRSVWNDLQRFEPRAAEVLVPHPGGHRPVRLQRGSVGRMGYPQIDPRLRAGDFREERPSPLL